MRWSRCSEFIRQDWAEFKARFLETPSPIDLLALAVLGAVLIAGAYGQRSASEAEIRGLERAIEHSDREARAAIREHLEAASQLLREHGVPESEIRAMKDQTGIRPE